MSARGQAEPPPRFLRVHPSFFIVSAVMAGSADPRPARVALWCAVVFVSVLLHELGHAAAGRAFGLTPWIELHGMGGTTFYRGGSMGALSTARRVAISLAGPAAGLLAGGLVMLAAPSAPPSPWVALAVRDALWVNVGWGLLNLLPMLPLDGGLAALALLDAATGAKGERPMRWVSLVVGALAVAAALYYGMLFAAVLAGYFASQNVGALRARAAGAPARGGGGERGGERVDDARDVEGAKAAVAAARDAGERAAAAQRLARAYYLAGAAERAWIVLDTMVPAAERDPLLEGAVRVSRGDAAGAVAPLRAARAAATDEAPRALATRSLVVALAESGALDEARALAEREAPAAMDREALHRLDAALFYAGRYADALDVAAGAFARFGHPEDAYNAACSCAKLGRADDGLAWLARALDAGWSDAAALESDDDLAHLRAQPGFDAIRARIPRAA